MRQLSPAGQQVINDIAQRHGISVDATMSMLDSVINGNGQMAQFSHPEFSGSGQWMRGGMTMVSDMFNHSLSARVDALCNELSNLVASQPGLVRSGSFQSQNQGGGHYADQSQSAYGSGNFNGSSQSQSSNGFGAASLFIPPAPGQSADWWPSELQGPSSTGAQNGVRYAYFPQVCRLAIDVGGTVTLYDTLDHHIGGFSQQQSVGGTLSFSSQHGLIDVASLPVIAINGKSVAPAIAPASSQFDDPTDYSGNSIQASPADQRSQTKPMQAQAHSRPSAASPLAAVASSDIFATLEKLAELRAKGILTDEEFTSKKAELLSRL